MAIKYSVSNENLSRVCEFRMLWQDWTYAHGRRLRRLTREMPTSNIIVKILFTFVALPFFRMATNV